MPKPKPIPAQTTPAQLSSIIKTARDLMRKDKGLSGDSDRLPQLTWMMFLKFIDDSEQVREVEAELAGEKFTPAIVAPYRWRDWAAAADSLTGDDLKNFINNDEAVLPNGKRGKGLFTYLKGLRGENGGDRRDVIAHVFEGTVNRMTSGYILREILTKINQINFTASEEIHTLSALYESMLKEMRDAAGDSGEFYTPRAVVRFMVEALDPQIGESVLDPACGTGGFLVESFEHMRKQATTVEKSAILQKGSITGVEAKPLPYLLCQMNLLLHGLEFPQIDYGNALTVKLGEIGDKQRVNVILTNPPFGGEEESKILSNFPADRQTRETALLFLQLIMRKLHRTPKPGRAAVVVPNGTLFGEGIAARIKEDLVKNYNLHTIVRLPNGVFAPYTGIPTNVLFFDTASVTKEIWYYEILSRDGGRYSKSKPVQFEEFQDCLKWWNQRIENEFAWKITASAILENGCNLDIRNPNRLEEVDHQSPDNLVKSILEKEMKIVEIIKVIHQLLELK
ncbi:MAG TPA: SAM-dependent methyltransferase [Anaerolineae bacterium]|jgi:type I restriction enzyme M protein|nr:SAM-dependent methyltransferase [Anaerolineae bacterium]